METVSFTVAIAGVAAALVVGSAFGFALAYWLRGNQAKDARAVAEKLLQRADEQRKTYEAQLLQLMQGKFSEVSIELMDKAQNRFLTLAEQSFKTQKDQHVSELEAKLKLLNEQHESAMRQLETRLSSQSTEYSSDLDTRKQLIDQQLNTMNSSLQRVSNLIKEFEDARAEKLGVLSEKLQKLTVTSDALQRALSDNKARGQWGERIAENILQLLGMQEGIDYKKQLTAVSDNGGRIRPDFTFLLPNNMCVNMDVKFPLDNYLQFTEASSQLEADTFRDRFLRDVKSRITEVSGKAYINSEQNTIDCVLVFIPNEQVYRFIHEHSADLMDEALQRKVILCSPITLFAVLAVVRQSVENFKLQASSEEILVLLNNFRKQWRNYTDSMDNIGKALDKAQDVYRTTTTRRTRTLDRHMIEVESLIRDRGLDSPEIMAALES